LPKVPIASAIQALSEATSAALRTRAKYYEVEVSGNFLELCQENGILLKGVIFDSQPKQGLDFFAVLDKSGAGLRFENGTTLTYTTNSDSDDFSLLIDGVWQEIPEIGFDSEHKLIFLEPLKIDTNEIREADPDFICRLIYLIDSEHLYKRMLALEDKANGEIAAEAALVGGKWVGERYSTLEDLKSDNPSLAINDFCMVDQDSDYDNASVFYTWNVPEGKTQPEWCYWSTITQPLRDFDSEPIQLSELSQDVQDMIVLTEEQLKAILDLISLA
jgi:hypothetical protein